MEGEMKGEFGRWDKLIFEDFIWGVKGGRGGFGWWYLHMYVCKYVLWIIWYSLTKLAVCCPADPEKGNCKFTHYWKLSIEDGKIAYMYTKTIFCSIK